MSNKLTIGLVGFGCVGSGLYEVLNKSKLIDAHIKTIVVKDPRKERSIPINEFSYEIKDIIYDDDINVVVELINDSDAALKIVKAAFIAGKHVVSANKKLIAEHLDELLALATSNNVSFLYEGAVAGSIPVIRNLEEYYNNDSLTSLEGITNGTTNYILTQANVGVDYQTALKEAQDLGFAESDPTLDVDGFDSKYKLVLLLKHAFGLSVSPNEVVNVGIRNITKHEVAFAAEKGYRIKLLSRAEKQGDEVVGFVAPHFVKPDHSAYGVDNEFNAVIVEALFSDKQLFYGKGAGSYPTASAVLSDVSALKFDYKYEYRKSIDGASLSFTKDFFVKVYLGSPYIEAINEIPFYKIDEVYQSEEYVYQTGWVRFSELTSINFNSRNDLSLVILPEPIEKGNLFIKKTKERRLAALEPAVL
ncbi:MAG: homoserine dehydrogenase [Crocinitomicaceae bacterium]|nr:homoserine dehydrogenase [Crocinitomicaceae bacterium]